MQCLHFGSCGGCSLRDVSYEEQSTQKITRVREILSPVISEQDRIKFIPTEHKDFYRHKMEFTFGVWDEELVLGMHEKGKFYKVIDLSHCFLQSQESNQVLDICRKWAKKEGITAYHKKRRTGILRNLIIKQTRRIPGMMVHLIATEKLSVDPLVKELQKIPLFKSLYISTYKGVSDIAAAESTHLVYGDAFLEELIGSYRYSIAPFTFFQSHTTQIELLYDTVKKCAGEGDVLIDLYCGVGGFAIYLASFFNTIYGIEVYEESVEHARYNAKQNNKNINFICGQAEHVISSIPRSSDMTMIIDPPRVGVGKKVLEHIAGVAPRRIIYVSCNPKSLVKDLEYLKIFYIISSTYVIDMFPHTAHVECITRLDRK